MHAFLLTQPRSPQAAISIWYITMHRKVTTPKTCLWLQCVAICVKVLRRQRTAACKPAGHAQHGRTA